MGTDFIKVDHIATDRLISELERRQRDEPGSWNAQQELRIKELSDRLNPPPIQR